MNNTSYLQGDSRWGGLVYPKKPCYIRNVGCGEVSIANILIEMEQYVNYTPATIQPYCKQYGAPNCDGTYLSGICKMMKHYGMEEVKECDTMPQLWAEMKKGERVAVLLMGSRPGGSKKVHWTNGGHFIAACGYRYEDNKHYLYIKDPWTASRQRNGWLSYEESLKGDVVGVYVGKLVQKKVEPSKDGKLAVDGIGGTNTIKATQKYFGTTEDGYIGDQIEKLSKYYPSITAVKFGKGKSGSQTVKALQKWLGLTRDGIIGQGTTAAWQKRLRDLGYLAKNETIDGIFGVKSMKAWQKFLNDHMTEDGGNTPSPTDPPKKTVYRVIDVSDHQRQIDWSKVKADGIVGAIIRYADGDTLDVRFRENMVNAKKAGLHIGSYIYSRAKTKAEAEKEAVRLFNACRDYDIDMPLYIDLEVKGLEKYANTVAQAFIAKIKALGGKPGVYANLNWWNNYLKPTATMSFAMWLAQYNDTMDYKPSSYVGMWQYSNSGKINGITRNVDLDELYVPYWETAPKLPRKTVDELAHEVIDNVWGKGDARKKDLTDAGYDYDAVQKRVNEIIASRTLTIGELANKYAYPTDTSKADYKGGSPTPEYTEGLNKAYPDRSKWGTAARKGASCDVFVGTCVRNAEVDKNFPRGLANQISYLAKSSAFKEVSVTTSTAQDGDIIVYTKTAGGGHICIVFGGKIKEAGFEHYYAKTTNTLKSRLSKTGKNWVKVYRAVTKATPTKTVDEVAEEVLDGKWGSGDKRKANLIEAGYDYDAVQNRVNEIVAFLNKIMDACQAQAEWSKDSKYEWESNPTVEKSKYKETCVTYVACVLQRVKLLASGKYIWHNKDGKVYGANDKFTIIYPNNKTLSQLKGELKAGDIIMDGDKTDLEKGSHIFIITGKWSGDHPIIWDNHSAQQKKGKTWVYTRNRPVIAIVRPKSL